MTNVLDRLNMLEEWSALKKNGAKIEVHTSLSL